MADEIDFGGSHWGDALSSSNPSLSSDGLTHSKTHSDNPNSSLTSTSTTHADTSITSKSKHNRITTLRSSRFNKKQAPKVHVEPVSSSDPLGPLGALSNDAESQPSSEVKTFGDKSITKSIKHYNSNNERLAMFGEDSNNLVHRSLSNPSPNPFVIETTNNEFNDLTIANKNIDLNANKIDSQNTIGSSSKLLEQIPQLNIFEITVGDPIKVGDITSAHTVYTVHTKTTSPNFNNSEASVTRRYRDFRWLYHALENNNPGVIIPPPPEKQAVGRFDEDFVESRRAALETMLNKCAHHLILQNDPDLRVFLQSETFSTDIKSKQYQAQNNSSNGGVESKGFMGSLGGAFSFSGKYVETDEWFLEKKGYVDTLESQFKYLEKSLDSVVTQRKELSDATAEFGNVLNSLSQVGLSKSFGELIERFSEVELRVRDLYYRQCLQDILSLGTTLDEYIRLISSIRNVFAQRQKAYFTVQLAEHELIKKRQYLEKVMKQGKTLQDKISLLKEDVDEQERKVVNLRVSFDDISKLIVNEFARFEQSKASDFRNSVELYLENAVEAQKEAIEIWETFYQLSGFVPVSG